MAQDRNTTPPLQQAMLSGAIMGVLGHGMGHLYLGLDPTRMDLRLHLDITGSLPMNVVAFLAFGSIFMGTLPLASLQMLATSALIATTGFTVLGVDPKLNFVYAQAATYISSALHRTQNTNRRQTINGIRGSNYQSWRLVYWKVPPVKKF